MSSAARRLSIGHVPGLAVATAAVGLLAGGHREAAGLVGIALIVALGLVLEVDLPWEGRVPLGYALLIAVAVLVTPAGAGLVVLGAVGVVAPFKLGRGRAVIVVVGAAAAAAAKVVFEAVSRPAATDLDLLVQVVAAGTAFLLVDLVVGRRQLRQAAPVYVTLLCAAALLAIAYRQSPALSLVAAVPLLVTKYSFGRFSAARSTYAQTTQALSLLPEVAGLTPLGHGERTAVYSAALAELLGFDAAAVDRIATAARLHHIGYISLHEPEERTGPVDTAELGRLSRELLRETGFLADVAELVEEAQAGGGATGGLEAGIIRVCSTLDELADPGGIGDQPPIGDPFAAVLVRHGVGADRTAAIALLQLHERHPGIIGEARAASRILALVAAGEHGWDHEAHDCR